MVNAAVLAGAVVEMHPDITVFPGGDAVLRFIKSLWWIATLTCLAGVVGGAIACQVGLRARNYYVLAMGKIVARYGGVGLTAAVFAAVVVLLLGA